MIRLGHTATVLGLTAVLCWSGCGDDGSNPPPEYDFSAFEAEVEAFMAEADLDGVGTILVHRDYGVIYQRSFGSFTDDRIYLIASASKMLSAGVIMRLDDEGLLDVDAPVVDAVDWGIENPTITPAQLVSNSSGLVGLLPNPVYPPYVCQYIAAGTLQDCAREIFTTDADDADIFPPDTQFRYGGAQWQVAGGVAEIVSGKTWTDLIRETYIEPCELDVLAYNNHFIQLAGGGLFTYPLGFDGNPDVLMPTENPNVEGGVYTTTGDYGKLLLMHLRGGVCGRNRVLSEDAVQRMRADRIGMVYGGVTGRADPAGYGMGWWVYRDTDSLVSDGGAYGAFPWIDENRAYGGFLVLEANTALGNALFARVYPIVNAAIDSAE
jgi:CubicO group peptidase (beta-lactamase class C family)